MRPKMTIPSMFMANDDVVQRPLFAMFLFVFSALILALSAQWPRFFPSRLYFFILIL